jgi:hypothetical protein
MKKDLLESIYGQIKKAVSGYTKTDIYYSVLPNEDLLKKYSIVYTVSNSSNTDTFDTKEEVKNYLLTVQINNPTTNPIVDSIVFIKQKAYGLASVNSSIKMVTLNDEDLFYDFDLKIFTGYLKYNIQYTQ